MMQMSPTIDKLASALAKAQGEIEGAKKESVNPHFKSKYADLESTWEACRKPLSKHGLSVVQMPYDADGRIGVSTVLLHESGEWVKGEISVRASQDNNPQVAGSILTYLRRYSLQGAVGIAPEDDDANAASGSPKTAAGPPQGLPQAAAVSGPSQPAPAPPPLGESTKRDQLQNALEKKLNALVDRNVFGTLEAAKKWATEYQIKKGPKAGQKGFHLDLFKMNDWQLEAAIKKVDEMEKQDAGGEDEIPPDLFPE